MKKIIFTLLIITLLIPSVARAQSTDQINNQIDELKNKVASKVAQLNLVEKRGVIGTVISASPSLIKITDINGNQMDINVDELTNYSSENSTSFDISDIKKDMQISVLGLYNKDSQKLLGRYVNETTIPLFLQGVANKDAKNLTVILYTKTNEPYTVDIEDITKIFEFHNNDLQASGFSKIPNLVNGTVVGYPNPKEKNRITAERLIVFPDSPKDPGIPIAPIKNSPAPSK